MLNAIKIIKFFYKLISFFSALFHSLIQIALTSVSDNTKQEAHGYYEEVVDLIDKKAQVEHTQFPNFV